jgi:hypothetical protein
MRRRHCVDDMQMSKTRADTWDGDMPDGRQMEADIWDGDMSDDKQMTKTRAYV